MLRFEGDRDFPHAPAALFALLSDARFLVQCIPDVESAPVVEADRAQLVLRPGFSFVRGTLEVSLRVVDAVAPQSFRVVCDGRGIGSSNAVEASLQFLPLQEGGARVHWVAEVTSLGGLLKLVPHGLVRGAAEKVVNDAWNRLAEKLPPPG
jgi:carbon monoxide dehydrogenase subunit G